MATIYMYVCWGNLTNRNHLEDLRVVGRIMLKLIFMKWDVARTEIMSLKIGTKGGLL
jgi:hypothetical protein